MKQFTLYTFLSAGIILLSFILLDVGAFERAYSAVQEIFIPLWESPFSSFSLVLTNLGSLSSALIFFTFIVVGLTIEGHWKKAAVVATTGLLTGLLVFLLKEIIAIPRPLEQLREVSGYRFPSGHAAASMAMALSFIYIVFEYTRSLFLRIPTVLVALSFAAIVGGTRIFMNVHRPLDIIAGFAVALCAMSISLILSRHLHAQE